MVFSKDIFFSIMSHSTFKINATCRVSKETKQAFEEKYETDIELVE